jgi:hypothetical protein
MKTKVLAVAASLLTLMSLAPAALAQASSGTIATKGPFAEADIFSVDASGILREVFIFSSTSTDKSPGGPATGSAVTGAFYLIVDTNTDTLLDEGSGFIDGTLTVAKKLTSASLSASGTLTSFIDGSEHDIAVDLAFTPNGPPENESDIQHISFGTIKLVNKFSGTFVPADLTSDSSASLDGVALDSLSSAEFGSTKSSTLTISK